MKRRDFGAMLARAGACAGAGALLPLLRGSPARAGGGAIPKRVVFVYCGEGMLPGDADMRPAPGAPRPTETAWELSTCLAPLAPWKRDMITFENLDMLSQHVDPTAPGNAHFAGETHALSAGPRLSGDLIGSVTIDQLIARELRAAGVVTALPSLEVVLSADMSYGENGWGGTRRVPSATGPGMLVEAYSRPEEVFDRVFPPGAGAPPDAGAIARQDRIFRFLRGESAAVADALDAAGRAKVTQHMDLLSDIERRRRVMLAGSDRRALWPDRSLVASAENIDWSYNADRATVWAERYRTMAPMLVDTIAAALHADVTRVATLMLSAPPEEGFGYVPGRFTDTDFHDLIHKVNGEPGLASNTAARDTVRTQIRSVMTEVERLVARLASLTEVDGSRLLDHTLVVYTSQIGYGSHSTNRLPWFTVGNVDGCFRTGRFLSFPRQGADWVDRTTYADGSQQDLLGRGRGHGDLFVSCANAVGVDITSFGFAEVSRGAIAEMR